MRCALRHPTCDGSRTGSPTFNSSCSAIHALLVQNTQTTLCSARHSLEERLSRWLLLAADRLDDRVVPVTHDMLSVSLGVRRASIIPRSSPLVQRRISAICRTLKYICSRLAISRSTRRTMTSRLSFWPFWRGSTSERQHAAGSARFSSEADTAASRECVDAEIQRAAQSVRQGLLNSLACAIAISIGDL